VETRVLCVIPARGGSKGIRLKNITPVNGEPLLHYSLTAAQNATRLSRVVLSSDHPEILAVARTYGDDVPLERPAELAQDDTASDPVALHALEVCEAAGDEPYGYVLLLQTTNPLVIPDDIDRTVELLVNSGCDSCVTVSSIGDLHPAKLKVMDGDRLLPYLEQEVTGLRQQLPEVYTRNHSCYAVRRSVLKEKGLYGDDIRAVVVPKERMVNIDDSIDLTVAEALLGAQRHRAETV
jgi:CMP-N-acetylneuraminic acid synthetase